MPGEDQPRFHAIKTLAELPGLIDLLNRVEIVETYTYSIDPQVFTRFPGYQR